MQRIFKHCVQVFDFHTRTRTTLVEKFTIGHVFFDFSIHPLLPSPPSHNIHQNSVPSQEPIQLGQRISKHCVQVFDFHTRTWTTLVEGTTIGHKRLHTTEAVVTDKVRVRVYSARAPPLLASLGLHYSEHPVKEPPRVYGRARFGGPASDI